MPWVVGTLVLLIIGLALRWLLRLGEEPRARAAGLPPLGPERDIIYQPVDREIETQATILGISLNDAIEERDAGHPEIAWHLVRLSLSEWYRLAEMIKVLAGTTAKHLAAVRVVGPCRSMAARRFKSRVMIDYVRMHELLERVVFRSKLRFQLHLRVLRRAVDTLSAEFRRAYRYGERTGDRPPELWHRLDLYFHDLDLVAKETLLAFRAVLASLPHSALAPFAADLKTVLGHRVSSISVEVEE